MAGKKPELTPETIERIRADVARWRASLWIDEGLASGRIDLGPACLCGAGARTLAAAHALRGKHGKATGECQRHPVRGNDPEQRDH